MESWSRDGCGRWRWMFDARCGAGDRLLSRWMFLRALGLIYFSAFYAFVFQVRGLIGERGILPVGTYLEALRGAGWVRFWESPTVLWAAHGDRMLMAVCWVGLVASVLVVLNVIPRAALGVCFVCFLSLIAVSQDFGQYQSDGMLLEAGFLAVFLAPAGMRPGLGRRSLPVRAAMFLLVWEWFRIYFESGVVKLQSGDRTWRNLTAMYEYYQNGPLPTWVGWYLEHLPHWFAIGTAGATLVLELVVVWAGLGPRRLRIACFWIVTVWQAAVIVTANYAFLNYLVLVLGVLLLDDTYLARLMPRRWRRRMMRAGAAAAPGGWWREAARRGQTVVATVFLSWIAYAGTVPLVEMFWRAAPLPGMPVTVLEPFRIANAYGLFATMTPHRYEIEFQGSEDRKTWTAYRFRYKPQDVRERPGIYAPYQPRFDWNLWFASLTSWQQSPIVPLTEERLLDGDTEVLGLFRGDPFGGRAPRYVRAVLWQYWFSTPEEKRAEGVWWRRAMLGTFAPTLEKLPGGRYGEVEEPELAGPPES